MSLTGLASIYQGGVASVYQGRVGGRRGRGKGDRVLSLLSLSIIIKFYYY